jgi:hypothetical protein
LNHTSPPADDYKTARSGAQFNRHAGALFDRQLVRFSTGSDTGSPAIITEGKEDEIHPLKAFQCFVVNPR